MVLNFIVPERFPAVAWIFVRDLGKEPQAHSVKQGGNEHIWLNYPYASTLLPKPVSGRNWRCFLQAGWNKGELEKPLHMYSSSEAQCKGPDGLATHMR